MRFLHCADIHLDSPLRGLERYEGAPVEEVRGASRRAFENMIQHALRERVDFVVIAGELEAARRAPCPMRQGGAARTILKTAVGASSTGTARTAVLAA